MSLFFLVAVVMPPAVSAFEFEPPAPTACDSVAIAITRSFTEDCGWSAAAEVTASGGAIDVALTPRGGPICLDVLIDETFTVPIGRFAAGEYTVSVSWTDLRAKAETRTLSVAPAAPGGCGAGFRRGDANSDSAYDVSDAVAALGHLFLGGDLDCLDAADADASGELDITDPIAILGHLFLGGSPPPAPFPGCGLPAAGAPRLGCRKPHCDVILPGEPVWMARADGCRQCERCPPLEEIVEGLAAQGIAVIESRIVAVNTCLACEGCPSGRFYLVLVSPADAEKLKAQGWGPLASMGLIPR